MGTKSAVGEICFWQEFGKAMPTSGRAVDFITMDGGEGRPDAAPRACSDHVSLPFKQGFSRVYQTLGGFGLLDRIVCVGSGKLGSCETTIQGLALECDMLAIGCIQAQRCQTGQCSTGGATQNRWGRRGLDPTLKSARLANHRVTVRKEVLRLGRSCGVVHPARLTSNHLELSDGRRGCRPGDS